MAERNEMKSLLMHMEMSVVVQALEFPFGASSVRDCLQRKVHHED